MITWDNNTNVKSAAKTTTNTAFTVSDGTKIISRVLAEMSRPHKGMGPVDGFENETTRG